MRTDKEINDKWAEVLDYARQHATGEGMHKGYRWLEDAFNEYLTMTDETPGYGMGGQSGGHHNRVVLAGKIARELRYVRDPDTHQTIRLGLTDEQLDKLTTTLHDIVDRQEQHQSLKI